VVQLTEMDRNVSLTQQLEDAGGPVLLVNKFDVAADEVDQFLAAWADDAKYFKRQPGYISAQLHRGIAGSCVFLNVSGVGVRGPFPRRLRETGVPRQAQPLSVERGCFTASVPESCRVRRVRGLSLSRQKLIRRPPALRPTAISA